MKKSDELRLKTRKLIAKNLIVLVALAVVAFVAAFSWFSETTTADAGSLTAKTDVCDSLEFYIMPPKDLNGSQADQYVDINERLSNNKTWNTRHPSETQKNTEWHTGALTLDFTDSEFKFLEDLFLCEVTSDGKTFYTPKIKQNSKVAYVDTGEAFTEAKADEDYLSYDIYFRSQSQYDIVLSKDSKIEPMNKENIATQGQIDTDDSANENKIKSAAIGAVRMSVQNGGTGDRELLWIPGPKVWFDSEQYLYTGLTEVNGDYGYSGKGTKYYVEANETFPYTDEGTNNHAYYTQSGSTRTRTVINSGDSNAEGSVIASTDADHMYELGSDVTIVSLNNQDKVNGYFYNHVRVNLWIEGEDSEARLAFVNGKFDLYMNFDISSNKS